MGWKKMILGEKIPDRNDPHYAGRYEKDVNAGRRFARLMRIDKGVACVQRFACRSPRLFLSMVFGIVIFCFALNVYRVIQVCDRSSQSQPATVVSHQERLLKEKRDNKTIKTDTYDTDRAKE